MTENPTLGARRRVAGGAVFTPNLERLRLWADELISGNREQGEGALRLGDDYCCLGVAVEVAMANGCKVEAVLEAEDKPWEYDGSRDFLPQSVSTWYGVNHNPMVGENPSADTCPDPDCVCRDGLRATEANDTEEWSFKQIGESIKKFYGLDAADA